MTGYGIGPTSTTSGSPNSRSGARSRCACSGAPAWQGTIAASLTSGLSGAWTTPAKTDQLVGHRPRELAVEAQDVLRLLERVRDQSTDDLPERVEAVLERHRDAEVAAAAPERPEEVGIATRP